MKGYNIEEQNKIEKVYNNEYGLKLNNQKNTIKSYFKVK